MYCPTKARHLLQCHKDQPMVAEAEKLPKNDPKRMEILSSIRKEATYKHNEDVLQSGNGVLIVERRSSQFTYTPGDYRPCPGCKGWYHKDSRWKHMDKCIGEGKYDRADSKFQYRALFAKDEILGPFQKVLSTMKEDDVCAIVKNDRIIQVYGQEIYERHRNTKEALASNSMRQLGRLLKQVHIDTKERLALQDLIRPERYVKLWPV